ncbi:hypothetical protein FRZ44_35390 [Hypericibacter terrae]|jgi:hypothetical protein|uniref:Uncharacterized protein n=1 Tax=Hypericibacter terrae TaxID=2602015 RepID=A0A5J6MLF7_9PROT|nr:Imm70 family immunity protein [Hypericibacter terrae]QEX18234.1 hypothetical protein FRZ44_35390 [Hypericibacter terrae]
MGLYLCIFENDEDVGGVDVGSYSDFNVLRDFIVRELETQRAGSRFPTLILHSDCDGEWSVADCEKLRGELAEIIRNLKMRPTVQYASDWQRAVAKSCGLNPRNAFESFIDVDGEFLLQRIQELADLALQRQQPIIFQ